MSPRRNSITYSQHPTHAARSAHAKGDKAFRTYDTSHIRPKRSKVPTIAGIIVLVLIIAGIVFGVVTFLRGCSGSKMLPEGQTTQVVVDEGEGVSSIGGKLAAAGVVSSASEFTSRVTGLGVENTLQPGTYTLTGGMTIDQVIKVLQTPVASVMFTIPEGYTLKQIAAVVADVTGGRISADDFIAQASNASVYATSYPFLEGVGDNSLEGYLFPKTYPITDNDTADSVIRMLLNQFRTETAKLDYSYAASKGLSTYDVVKLASIIESETDANHRAVVSSVLYNRLDIGMRLQVDATSKYVLGRAPTPADLQEENEYNTYLNAGLPPTPICSPSLDSLVAACNPDDTDYMYFYIAPNEDGEVEYYFSVTYDEHQESFS